MPREAVPGVTSHASGMPRDAVLRLRHRLYFKAIRNKLVAINASRQDNIKQWEQGLSIQNKTH